MRDLTLSEMKFVVGGRRWRMTEEDSKFLMSQLRVRRFATTYKENCTSDSSSRN